MALVAVLLFIPALFYVVLIGAGAVGFHRTRLSVAAWAGPLPSVSIVIPARNESTVIGACLEAVLANDYPEDLLEVIVVDDGSEDDTAAVVRSYVRKYTSTGVLVGTVDADDAASPVRLVQLARDPHRRLAHKKEALRRGVAASRGAIVITTDADCVVEPTWIRTMVEAFDDKTGMVTGPVLYRRDGSFFSDVQALEFLGLVALGAGLVRIGRPHLCNSANLAYRRDVYEEVGGYEGLENISTGDDEMLMHRVAYETDWKVRTCMSPRAVVETNPNASMATFFRQRRRWASAHARYPHPHLTAVSVLCYLFYVELVVGAAAVVLRPDLAGIVAMLFVLKLAVEAAIVIPAARRFGRTNLLRLFPLAELLQIAYVLVIGAAGTFGGYEWKGRRVPR